LQAKGYTLGGVQRGHGVADYRRTVENADRGGSREAVQDPVVDDELGDVVADPIGDQGGLNGLGVLETGRAVDRLGQQRPAVGQGIVVGIAGLAAVQGEGLADMAGLIGPGFRQRTGIHGADGD
jgi:hypothetical protein